MTLLDYVGKVSNQLISVSHSPLVIKLIGTSSCGRGGRTFLIWHIVSRDHMIRVSHDILSGSPSAPLTILSSLMLRGLVEEEM